MKNLKMILGLAFLAFMFLGNASNFNTETIYFDVAKSDIKENQKDKLDKLSKANQIYLVGHTDSDGNNEYNKSLSESRVKSVYQFLLKNGLSKNKMDIEYYGESKPLNKNIDETQKALNRRVEIKYIIDPLMDFEVEKQVFDINDNTETIIKGKNGTEIIIPAHTFDAKNVKLELQEFYSNLDILSSNLSTKANGELLETSGMVYLEAVSSGKKVKPKKEFTIKFKKMSTKEDFQLFEGNRSKADLDMNWNAMGVETEEKHLDKFNKVMNDFTVHSTKGLLLNEGKYSWFSIDEGSENYSKSASWESWNQFFNYDDFFNTKDHRCFTQAELFIEIDNNGEVKNLISNNENPYCKKMFEDIVNEKISSKTIRGESELNIHFDMDFSEIDSITTYREEKRKVIQAEWNAKQDSIFTHNEEKRKIMQAVWQEKQDSITDFYTTRRDSINEFMAEQRVEAETRNKVNYEANLIVQKSSKLGWINCDRFVRSALKTNYLVKISDSMNVRMVVNRYNSFFNSFRHSQSEMKFSSVPLGEKVTLICTSYKDGKILLAIEKTTISKKPFSDFNFKVVSKEELKHQIQNI